MYRNPRAQSFARVVIAEATRRHNEAVARAALPTFTHCPTCTARVSEDDECYPYCSKRCAVEAEVDNG